MGEVNKPGEVIEVPENAVWVDINKNIWIDEEGYLRYALVNKEKVAEKVIVETTENKLDIIISALDDLSTILVSMHETLGIISKKK